MCAALKGFKYCIALGDTVGDVTDDGECLTTAVADRSKLIIPGLPALPIPADLHGYLDVIVCFIVEVNRVFVQLLNEGENLEWTACMLQAVYNDPDAEGVDVISNPRRGQLCVVKCPLDGRWYRASVIERTSPSDVKVYYVDYGNTDTVNKTVVRAITALFASRPPQAIAISLANVSCADAQMNLSDVCTFIENREVTICLEANTGTAFVASMTYLSSSGTNVVVNDIIMGRSHTKNAHVESNRFIQTRTDINANTATFVGTDQLQKTLTHNGRISGATLEEHGRSVNCLVDQEKQQHVPPASILKDKDPLTMDTHQATMTSSARLTGPAVDPTKMFDRMTLLWMRTYLPACWERPSALLEEHFVMASNNRKVWNPQSWWMSHFGEDEKQSAMSLQQKRNVIKHVRNNRPTVAA